MHIKKTKQIVGLILLTFSSCVFAMNNGRLSNEELAQDIPIPVLTNENNYNSDRCTIPRYLTNRIPVNKRNESFYIKEETFLNVTKQLIFNKRRYVVHRDITSIEMGFISSPSYVRTAIKTAKQLKAERNVHIQGFASNSSIFLAMKTHVKETEFINKKLSTIVENNQNLFNTIVKKSTLRTKVLGSRWTRVPIYAVLRGGLNAGISWASGESALWPFIKGSIEGGMLGMIGGGTEKYYAASGIGIMAAIDPSCSCKKKLLDVTIDMACVKFTPEEMPSKKKIRLCKLVKAILEKEGSKLKVVPGTNIPLGTYLPDIKFED